MNSRTSLGAVPPKRVWRIRPSLSDEHRSSFDEAGYTPLLAQLFYNRGITDAHQARAFLSKEPVSHDPMSLPGMEAAVPRLKRALERKERIAVFGDFDVDGVTATALMARALKPLGSDILPYIPHRVQEGHGLTLQAVQTLIGWKVDLLITVDCGVTSYDEIDAAARAGIDTIVTDHHLAPEGPPRACAVVDPQLSDSLYPFPGLTGVGLALKLAQGLYQSIGWDDASWQSQLLPLAALGTVADVAPLLDENRSIVRQGLQELSRAPTPGLKALMRSARLEGRVPDTETIGWVLAPRLNAAGRMDHANVSYQLLVTDSDEEAATLARTLEEQNRERQRLTSEAQEKAKTLVEVEPLLMVGDPSFTPGIIGLVAAKLVDEFHRPAVVVSLGQDVSQGSCRSVPEFDIGGALHQVATSMGGLIRHGGHHQAAGFTVSTAELPTLRQRLVSLARDTLGEEASQPQLDIDLEVPLGSLPRDVYRTIGELAPFGVGNPLPVFLSRNVQLVDSRSMGADGQHLRLKLADQGVMWNAVAFKQGANFPSSAKALDVVYTIRINYWRGEETLQLNVLDFRVVG